MNKIVGTIIVFIGIVLAVAGIGLAAEGLIQVSAALNWEPEQDSFLITDQMWTSQNPYPGYFMDEGKCVVQRQAFPENYDEMTVLEKDEIIKKTAYELCPNYQNPHKGGGKIVVAGFVLGLTGAGMVYRTTTRDSLD